MAHDLWIDCKLKIIVYQSMRVISFHYLGLILIIFSYAQCFPKRKFKLSLASGCVIENRSRALHGDPQFDSDATLCGVASQELTPACHYLCVKVASLLAFCVFA